jgi:hypothetical protein
MRCKNTYIDCWTKLSSVQLEGVLFIFYIVVGSRMVNSRGDDDYAFIAIAIYAAATKMWNVFYVLFLYSRYPNDLLYTLGNFVKP